MSGPRSKSPISAQTRLHFVVFLWGFTGLLGALIHLNAWALVWNRMGLAIAVLYAFFLWKKWPLYIHPERRKTVVLAGAIIMLHWVTFFAAIKVSKVSVALVCLSTGAFFGSLLEPLFFKKKIDYKELLLSLLAIVGLATIFQVETEHRWGIGLGLTSALLSALFSLINGKLIQTETAHSITFFELLSGWMLLGLCFALPGLGGQFAFPPPVDMLWLVLLATACTAYAFVESVEVMKVLSPFTVLLSINLEPLYGIAVARWVLGDQEAMSPAFYLGAGLILTSVLVNAWLKARFTPPLPPSAQTS
ncbi:EamA family transporter [bacterium]|nr:EamA family transporter [bacterium]